DYAMVGLTFAFNRGTMQNVMTWGTVTCAAGAGGAPNNYVIDIPIPGGFVYDPTAGADLLIDITGPAFVGTMPRMSVSFERCKSVFGTPSGAVDGSFSLCPVVLFDILGPGGILDNGGGFPLLAQ